MTHKATCLAQIILSAIFIGGYFTILTLFIMGYVRPPADWKDALQALLGVLTAGVMTILSFWFQRQRTNSMAAK